MRSLVVNLIDNAIRHARESVLVTITDDATKVTLTVDDDGPGITPDDCSRVFERFVRLDDSRDRDEGGSGLGLAIVASVVDLHHGHAWATPGPGGHFIVTLPSAPDAMGSPDQVTVVE